MATVRAPKVPVATLNATDPVRAPCVAVSVVLPALKSVIEGFATPRVKVTEDEPVAQVPRRGRSGRCPSGRCPGH